MEAPQKAAARVAALRELIRRHDQLYYVEGAPEIGDSAPLALTTASQLPQHHPQRPSSAFMPSV